MAVDLIASDGTAVSAHGSVAEKLLSSGMNPNVLRTNAVLRKDEWEQLDSAVVNIARERLNAVSDLVTRGLVYNVANGMGTTIVQHETVSEMTRARVTMDGVTRGENDRVTFNLVSTPLPIIHHDFQISARVLAASRQGGSPLDTTQVEEATRQVAETTENMLLNGVDSEDSQILGFGSSAATIRGYTDSPNKNDYTISATWTAAGTTGATIVADVLAMISAAQVDRMFGPYIIYIPSNYWVKLQDDYKANSDKTTLSRIKEIAGIDDVKPADKLADSNVLLVQMTKSNVDMVIGMQPTTVQWEAQGGMMSMFKVMSIMVPRIKSDHDDRSGVVLGKV